MRLFPRMKDRRPASGGRPGSRRPRPDHRFRPLAPEAFEGRVVPAGSVAMSLLQAIPSAGGAPITLVPTGSNPPGVQPTGANGVISSDMVCATFTYTGTTSDAPIRVGLASYGTNLYDELSGSNDPATAKIFLDAQVFVDSATAVLSAANPTVTLCVNVSCAYENNQVDGFFYTTASTAAGAPGGLITNFASPTSDYYGYNANGFPSTGPNRLLGGAIVFKDCDPGGPGPPVPSDLTARTQGFWKNHPEAMPNTLAIAGVSYTREQLVAIFQTPPRGNKAIIAAHQLIAAKLNAAQTLTPPDNATVDAINAIEAIFLANNVNLNTYTDGDGANDFKPNASIGAILVLNAGILDDYNNSAD